MNKIAICLAIVALLLMPYAVGAQDDQSASKGPPIAQPLVREGDFALRLVEVLKLGKAESEAQAETMLSEIGVAPAAGWIADYPVTPDVLTELRSDIQAAADAGKLSLGRDEALQSFSDLTAQYGLPLSVPAESTNAGDEPPQAARYYPNQTTINNYYDYWGPPVVTWYRPPWEYFYLYAWIPFAFGWNGYWFPGYYCLTDFDRVVVVEDCGTHYERRCTNHRTVDPYTRRVTTIDPAKHARAVKSSRVRASDIPPRSSSNPTLAPAVRTREMESSPHPSRFSADDQRAARMILDRQLKGAGPPHSRPGAEGRAYGDLRLPGSDGEVGVQRPKGGRENAISDSGYLDRPSKRGTRIASDRGALSNGPGSRRNWGESFGSSTKSGSGNAKVTIAPRGDPKSSTAPVRVYEQGSGLSAIPKSSTRSYSAPSDKTERFSGVGIEATPGRMDRSFRAPAESPPTMLRRSLGPISGMGAERSFSTPSAPRIGGSSSGGFQGRGMGTRSR